MRAFDNILEEYEFLDPDERKRLLIELAQALEHMPEVLKTDATKVKGCVAQVWAYPRQNSDGSLHFLADSDSIFTKGMIAVVLSAVQDRMPDEIVRTDINALLKPFDFKNQLTSLRASNLPNMIALVRDTAARYAALPKQ